MYSLEEENNNYLYSIFNWKNTNAVNNLLVLLLRTSTHCYVDCLVCKVVCILFSHFQEEDKRRFKVEHQPDEKIRKGLWQQQREAILLIDTLF